MTIILLFLTAITSCTTEIRGKELSAEYYNLGNAYFEIARYEKAVEFYQKALQLDTSLTRANLNLSIALIKSGKPDEAEQILLKLHAEDPKNITTMETLAYAYHALGQDEKALATYDQILEISSENINSLNNSGVLLWKLGRLEEAVERFRRLLSYSPEDLGALYNLGELSLSLERPEEAVTYLQQYLQQKPDALDVYALLARSYEILRQFSKALDAYEGMLAADQKVANAWFGKARLLLTVVEDPEKGLVSLSQALNLGFRDQKSIAELLDADNLLEKDRVKELLKEKNLLPAD